ncbi:MAG: hypothetical protein DMG78_32730, partial [Acidobacteria bacterium]
MLDEFPTAALVVGELAGAFAMLTATDDALGLVLGNAVSTATGRGFPACAALATGAGFPVATAAGGASVVADDAGALLLVLAFSAEGTAP